MPARAPPSIDMLQTVMRPSMERSRIASPRILDHMALAAGDANLSDDRQNDILGGNAGSAAAVNLHQHGFGFELHQALRGQHVLNFACADAERQRSQPSVRGGVAVTANNRQARLSDAQFRPDDVDNALVGTVHVKKQDPGLAAVAARASICAAATVSVMGRWRFLVGTE